MKNFLYWSAASIAALALTSCAQEEIQPVNPDGLTTIEITLPEQIATRYGEGDKATNLFVAVYPKGANDVLMTNLNGAQEGLTVNNFAPGSLTTTVQIQLVKNNSYDLIFWAESGDAKSAPYTFSPENKTVTVDYTGMTNFDDDRDAFYAHLDDFTANGQTVSVTLNRPFAQINIGTDDLAAYLRAAGANVKTQNFGMKVTGVANVLNLGNGTVSSTDTFNGEVTVAQAELPTTVTDAFPNVNYTGTLQYLDMGYFLVGDLNVEKTNLEVALSVGSNAAFATYSNVPAQMNFRTNIYGSLLTNKENFNISIDPIFGTPDYNVAAWDGTTVTTPKIDETTKTVTLSQPSDFAGLAQMVNGSDGQTANNFAGYTINIPTDMDFGGHEIPMLGDGATRKSSAANGNSFQGVIDGQGNTIKNFTIANTNAAPDEITGFVTSLKGANAALKNLNFENIALSTNTGEQLGVVGIISQGATVSNVHVLSGTINGHEAVGAIAGRILMDGTIENCYNAATVKADSYNVGGIVGAAYYTAVGKEMHINNCTNTGSVTSGGVATGGIVGFSTAFISGCTNNAPVTGLQNSVGGIAGTQRTAGGITDCHNSGDITGNPNGTNQALGVGGIAGWVTYQGGASYPNKNVITISGCSNSGKIVATASSTGNGHSYAAGGIVGLWYNMGTVQNCTNTAPLISAQQMVAGIIGSSQWLAESADIPEGAEEMLYITGNNTTTTLDQMQGDLKALLVYVNDAARVTFSGNTPAANQ